MRNDRLYYLSQLARKVSMQNTVVRSDLSLASQRIVYSPDCLKGNFSVKSLGFLVCVVITAEQQWAYSAIWSHVCASLCSSEFLVIASVFRVKPPWNPPALITRKSTAFKAPRVPSTPSVIRQHQFERVSAVFFKWITFNTIKLSELRVIDWRCSS